MEVLVGKRIRPLTALSPDLTENELDGAAASNDGMSSLKSVFDSVRRYRRLIVTMIVGGLVLTLAATLLMPATYQATAQLAADVRPSGGNDAAGAGALAVLPAGAEDSIIDTHITVLLSDAFLRRLLPTIGALDDERHRKDSESHGLVHSLGSLLARGWAATKELVLFKKQESNDARALAALKRSLKVGQERRSRIIGVTATSSDPRRAADIANTVAQSYLDEVTRQRQGDVEQALSLLSTQSNKIQHDLAAAEDELAGLRLDQPSASRDRLEWRVVNLAQQYETLLRRRQELTSKGLVVQPDVSLLALASAPERPTSLHPLLIVPPAAIIFALLGCVLAVILTRLDRTLHTEAEAAEALRVPCAGRVPSISPDLSKQLQHVLGQPASDYARAVRSVLASVLASGSIASPSQRIVLVGSSMTGEGKTTLAWCLGLQATQLGLRTLLLDFGQAVRRRGDGEVSLLSLLTPDRTLSDVVEPIQHLGIDYLPAGLSDGNRLRLLANPKIVPTLRQASEAYDLIIIDGPALQEAPEARLLAAWADHVLLAVHCGTTDREKALSALRQFARIEQLNPTQTTRFSSVLTRSGPSQVDQPGQSTEPWLKRIIGGFAAWPKLWPRRRAAATANKTRSAPTGLTLRS